ncbi:hypothetical protein QZH41_003696 [Actinostola sp. cb2023]|nr:hypothetical protein QZH41_003696 [Actinostola sp. cb2023]
MSCGYSKFVGGICGPSSSASKLRNVQKRPKAISTAIMSGKRSQRQLFCWHEQLNLPAEEFDDVNYTYTQAAQAIKSWKMHQLRSVRQDSARTTCLRALDETSVLITQDWAMKYLPTKYRESHSDWFAKRGISWHISVASRKIDNTFESQSFLHIVQNSAQDSSAVVRIMEHSLRTLKEDHPEIVTAYMRQDNAGCYHNSVMLASCSLMKEKTGISVQRVDFSDPQGGKGPCDRKAAAVKAHVRRYVNEGHDVQNAQQFQQAMLANGGVSGVRVAIVDAAALMLKYVNGDKKYQSHDVTVNVGSGYVYQQTGLLRFRVWTNENKKPRYKIDFATVVTEDSDIFSSVPGKTDVRGKGSQFEASFNFIHHFALSTEEEGNGFVMCIDSDLKGTDGFVYRMHLGLHEGYSYLVPLYWRYKYEGRATNHLMFPLYAAVTRNVVRQPIGAFTRLQLVSNLSGSMST